MNSKNIKDEEWVKIPGFPNYQVNVKTFTVRNIAKGNTLKASRGNVSLYNKDGLLNIGIKKLIFSVIKGIHSNDVPANTVFMIEGGKFEVYDKCEYLSRKKAEYAKIRNATINPIEEYKKGRDFIDKVILSLETGDMHAVFDEVYKYKTELTNYTLRNYANGNHDFANEVAHCALEVTVGRIMDGALVPCPIVYLKGVVRGMIAKIRADRSRQNELIRTGTTYSQYYG